VVKVHLFKVIVLIVAVCGFLMLKPNDRMLYTGDDDDYFAVASSIVYGGFPSFSNEYHHGRKMPFASAGPGVLASPFVFAFSLIDRFQDAPIAESREVDNRYWSWSVFGFHFASYFYCLLALLLLYEALRLWGSEVASFLTVLVIALGGGGLMVYVFKRPVMSHVYEFMMVSAAILLVSLALKDRFLKFHAELMGLCAAFIFLTRYNNGPLALGVMLVFLHLLRKKKIALAGPFAKMSACFLAPILLFRVLPVFTNGYSAYDQKYAGGVERVMPEMDPLFYWQRLQDIVFGADMGLIYTAPVLLLGILAVCLYGRRLPRELLFLSAFTLVNFYAAVMWRSFGSYYGYRYIVFTAMPLLAVYLMFGMDRLLSLGRGARLLLVVSIVAVLVLPLVSMFVFAANSKYGLYRMINEYGVATYSQPGYHANLLTDLRENAEWLLTTSLNSGWEQVSLNNLHEPLVQRLLLYVAPPALFLLFMSIRLREKKMAKGSSQAELHEFNAHVARAD